jgi:aldehyde dehydrogenase (NAD+)
MVSVVLNKLRTQHFINNEFVDSVNGETFDTFNPATEEKIATLQKGSAADVDRAVEAAQTAFKKGGWRDVSGSKRRDMLLKLADLLELNKQYFAEVESNLSLFSKRYGFDSLNQKFLILIQIQ